MPFHPQEKQPVLIGVLEVVVGHDDAVAVHEQIRPAGDDEALGVIDIGQIALEMQAVRRRSSFTSAPFALQMIEGVQKVRFTQKA